MKEASLLNKAHTFTHKTLTPIEPTKTNHHKDYAWELNSSPYLYKYGVYFIRKHVSKAYSEFLDSFVNIHYVGWGSKGNIESPQIPPN